jgi:hypothetical protein
VAGSGTVVRCEYSYHRSEYVLLLLEPLALRNVRIRNSSDLQQSISRACGSSKAVNDLVEELLVSGVLALSQPPTRFMMLCWGRDKDK